MKNLKKLIIITTIIFLILILIIALFKYKYGDSIEEKNIQGNTDMSGYIDVNLKKLEDHSTFYLIEKTLNNYYLYREVKNGTAIYMLLDKEYITNNSINENNAVEIVNNSEANVKPAIREIYEKADMSYPTYLIKMTDISNVEKGIYYILYKDNVNLTCSVKPILKDEYELYIQGQKELICKNEAIERNKYNLMKRTTLSDSEKIQKYYDNYQNIIEKNIEEAYNLLDKEYREKRFDSIEKFKNYLNNIKNTGIINKYRIVDYDEYKEYIYIDENNNYYIFRSTAAFEYTVLLDNYTIETSDFLERYNKATDKEKFQMNLEKISNALSVGDYEYIYNKLDTTFKQNNYKTLIDFENYVKENYNVQDKIEYGIYEEISNVGIVHIEVTNEEIGKEDIIKVVMKLNEGTDFVISFGKES